MKLDVYLKQQGLTQAEFGASLSPPVSQGLVSQWIQGKTAVSLHYCLEIGRETDGLVTAQDCHEMLVRDVRSRSKKSGAAYA